MPTCSTRRFSAKEERRRVVAAIHDPARLPSSPVGFENHLNYYHRDGRGLTLELARGLAAFLNSTLVDAYFGSSTATLRSTRPISAVSATRRGRRLEALGHGSAIAFRDRPNWTAVEEEFP